MVEPADGPTRPPATGGSTAGGPVLQVENVAKTYALRRAQRASRQTVTALDDVSLTLHRGETLGIVGESGSGKSTLGNVVSGLAAPDRGRVLLDGRPLPPLVQQRGADDKRSFAVIFQDPASSLNPRLTVEDILCEPWVIARDGRTRSQRRLHCLELLESVGMPAGALAQRPSSFSGGQQQRIAIARALAIQPRVLIADEPVSSLDVSVQAQILALLRRLGEESEMSMLFISHDLGVVRVLCDTVAVMHRGTIVEHGDAASVFKAPRHPYTRELLEARPTFAS